MRKNNTIKQYIGSGAVEIKENTPVFTLAPPDAEVMIKAQYLMRRYNNVMGREFYGKGLEKYQQIHLLSFMKLAQRFDTWTFAGLKINSIQYLLAHKWYYGKELFVNHLLSENSYEIYESYMRMKKSVQVKFKRDDYEKYDLEVVETLAHMREETREETQEILELCGLL